MTFTKLATGKRIPNGGRQSPRNSKITGFTKHHQAGVNAMGEATNPARVVSAQLWIANNGTVYAQVSENMRAWTTGAPGYPAGAQSDHRNITTEISNTTQGRARKTWEISDKALASDINTTGEIAARRGLGVIKRGLRSGVALHRDFVPTNCPGPYYVKHLNSIIKHAELVRQSYVAGKPRHVTAHDVAAFTGGSSEHAGDPKKATFLKGGSAPAPTPKPTKPSSKKKWPSVALPITKKHTKASHAAWVKLMADVGFKDKSLTSAIQRWLKSLGFYHGNIDTHFGPLTIDALQRFLASKGIYKGLFDAYQVPYSQSRGPMMVESEIRYLNSQRKYY